MVSSLELNIELKKGEYFNYGNRYFVEFNYGNKEQQDKMYELFEQVLVTHYGSNSTRGKEGKDYIMPYFVDERGQVTQNNTRKIGGTSIPEDLLPEFIRRFVEVDGATVKVGNGQIKGQFDYGQFNEIVSNLVTHQPKR